MTAPIIWTFCFQIAQNEAEKQGIVLFDPAQQVLNTQSHDPYWFMEISSGVSQQAGPGETAWIETGVIWFHLMMIRGTGTPHALALRKQFSDRFRTEQASQWDHLPTGLVLGSHSFEPPDLNQAGARTRFTLGIEYEFQEILT